MAANSQSPKAFSVKRWMSAFIPLAVIAMIIGLILVVFRNNTVYSVDKTEAKTQMNDLFAQLKPSSSELLYQGVIDEGCNNDSSVGLATRIQCRLTGYKYFRTQKNVSQDMHEANRVMSVNGWNLKSVGYGYTLNQVLSGAEAGSLFYVSAETSQRKDLSLELDNPDKNNIRSATIKQLVRSGWMNMPNPEDKVFGIRVSQIYWSCEQDSLFVLPCSPPSALK